MTKTIFSLLLLAGLAFGQDQQPMLKRFFDEAFKKAQDNAQKMEGFLPLHNKAFNDLSNALANGTPDQVSQAFGKAWNADLGLQVLMSGCKRNAEYLPSVTQSALERGQISTEESDQAIQLSSRLQELAKRGESKPELIAKTFAYAFKESGRVMDILTKAVEKRKQAAEGLANKIGGDKAKVEVYAERMSNSQDAVLGASKQQRAVQQLLWYVEHYFKLGDMSEEEYDKAQKLIADMKVLDQLRWAPKDQLAIYKQAVGEENLVSFILKN